MTLQVDPDMLAAGHFAARAARAACYRRGGTTRQAELAARVAEERVAHEITRVATEAILSKRGE